MKAPTTPKLSACDYSVESAVRFRLPSCVFVTEFKGDKPSESWYTVEAFHRAPFDSPAYAPFIRGFGTVKSGTASFVLSSDLERAFSSRVLRLEEEREAYGLAILPSMRGDWEEAIEFARAFEAKKKKEDEESERYYASQLSGDTVRFGNNKTLNVNEESAAAIIASLRERFPNIR